MNPLCLGSGQDELVGWLQWHKEPLGSRPPRSQPHLRPVNQKKKKILFLFKSSFLLLAPWSSLNDTEVLLPNLPVTVLRKLQRTNSEQRFSVFINSKCMLLSCLRKESNQYIHIFFWVYVIFFHWIMNSKHFYNSKLTKWGCIKLKYINY